MAGSPSVTANEGMLDVAERLVREFGDVPAGAVLRCVAQALRRARRWGCPPEHLVWTVEASTRWRLVQCRSAAEPSPGSCGAV